MVLKVQRGARPYIFLEIRKLIFFKKANQYVFCIVAFMTFQMSVGYVFLGGVI